MKEPNTDLWPDGWPIWVPLLALGVGVLAIWGATMLLASLQ